MTSGERNGPMKGRRVSIYYHANSGIAYLFAALPAIEEVCLNILNDGEKSWQPII